MKNSKYIHTGLRDRNGKEIKVRNVVEIKRPAIEYQTHYGDNIPNGAYTEPCGVMIEVKQYEVIYELGCFFLRDLDKDFSHFDSSSPLFYQYLPNGELIEYSQEECIWALDLKKNRDMWDDDYSEAEEDFKYLLEENKMNFEEFKEYCKIEIISKNINTLGS